MTLPTISTRNTIALSLPTTSFPETEKNVLQQAMDSKNTQAILTALTQTKAGDHGVITCITNTLVTKDNGLDQEAKSALCDHLKQNGVDLHEPISEGKTAAQIAHDNQDHELTQILEKSSANNAPTSPRPASTANPLNNVAGVTAAGTIAALIVSPFVRIIDQSMVESLSGKSSGLVKGLQNGLTELCKQPISFIRNPYYSPVVMLYAGTYITANTTETVCNNLGQDSTIPKLIFSSTTNIILSNIKDGIYAQLGGKGPARPMPLAGRTMLFVRDVFTMGAAFTLPPYAAEVCKKYGMSDTEAHRTTQLLVPALMQAFITPFHLLSFDLYNHPGSTLQERYAKINAGSITSKTMRSIQLMINDARQNPQLIKNRFARIGSQYPSALVVRTFRAFTAYGIGGVSNNEFKKLFSSSEPKEL